MSIAVPIFVLANSISFLPSVIFWGASVIVRSIQNAVTHVVPHVVPHVAHVAHVAHVVHDPAKLPRIQDDIARKLQNGELVMYEIAAPSQLDPNGIYTKYLILDLRDKRPVHL